MDMELRGQPLPMTHVQRVQRLYRQSLRLSADWYWERSEWREKAMLIRDYFEANRGVTNMKEADELCNMTEVILAKYHHPAPFKYATAPGGTKWERNIPFPKELLDKFVPFDNST
ncbi:hypothetical protein HDU78_010835 [Chytriomyces hyalinus]|nr:hypothetical protein HDU78_010835 [Chytriomyces hyalinus]KAJ3259273.1 hypothetical protein HDU77_001928 [Chytriomyces hyalinus]